MYNLRLFLSSLWKYLAAAELASDYHPHGDSKQYRHTLKKPLASMQAILDRHHQVRPRLDKPAKSFAQYVRGYSSLPLNDRALVALRSAYLNKAHYLLPGIVAAALDHGLTPSDIKLIANGRFAPGWSHKEQLLIQVTDDLYRKQKIELRTWKRLCHFYSPDQILDIVLSAAAFHLCSLT
ncbi:carboxymuconolactone decarboxylase family protein [Endozoicomonas sp. Mp262]|uniref:carboxymuconolactone decarboxylase family protein n=1 Tax=Endozoicomonas sp. Mp262 TaxID=2919499 RepID=UPI0021D9E88C